MTVPAATPVTVARIAADLGGEVLGDPHTPILRISPLDAAAGDAISFLASARLRAKLDTSGAGCVIVNPALREAVAPRRSAILAPDPYLYYARLTQWWKRRQPRTAGAWGAPDRRDRSWRPRGPQRPRRCPHAVVGPDAELAAGVDLGPNVVIGAGATIGLPAPALPPPCSWATAATSVRAAWCMAEP